MGQLQITWSQYMDITDITLPAALLAGLAFGAGPCNVTCLPYLGPVFLRGDGVAESWKILLPFSLGRVSGYAVLGLIAGTAGQLIAQLMQSRLAGWVLGLATILVGISLILNRAQKKSCNQQSSHEQRVNSYQSLKHHQHPLPLPLYMMGAGMALNPCLPLTAILAAATASGSWLTGLGLGLAFGMGAVLIPSLVFGLLIAHFGAELQRHIGSWAGQIQTTSGSLLILLGLVTTLGWVQP